MNARLPSFSKSIPGDFFRAGRDLRWLDAELNAQDPLDAYVIDRQTKRRGYVRAVLPGSRVQVAWWGDDSRICDQTTVHASTVSAEI